MATTPATPDAGLAAVTHQLAETKLAENGIRVYYEVDRGAGCGDDDKADAWIMYFEGRYGPSRFKFAVCYPHHHSVDDWDALAAGQRNLDCYQGNGYGGVEIVGDMLRFGAGPSGAGGDVDLTVDLPLALVAEPLRAAIRAAVAEGLRFAPA
jgi:hypothetical protein